MAILTTSRLIELGQALYGEDWEGSLAHQLKVNRRTVNRWRAGTHPMPPGLLTVLLALVEQRLAGLISKRLEFGQSAGALPHGKIQQLETLFCELADSGAAKHRDRNSDIGAPRG